MTCGQGSTRSGEREELTESTMIANVSGLGFLGYSTVQRSTGCTQTA
jgi:hypothetical protein